MGACIDTPRVIEGLASFGQTKYECINEPHTDLKQYLLYMTPPPLGAAVIIKGGAGYGCPRLLLRLFDYFAALFQSEAFRRLALWDTVILAVERDVGAVAAVKYLQARLLGEQLYGLL